MSNLLFLTNYCEEWTSDNCWKYITFIFFSKKALFNRLRLAILWETKTKLNIYTINKSPENVTIKQKETCEVLHAIGFADYL